jgi:hypothetical protein
VDTAEEAADMAEEVAAAAKEVKYAQFFNVNSIVI